MHTRAFEVNFDGLIGPTHNYSGLSYGNVASVQHRLQESNPRQAALQGLAKMRFLHQLGAKQAVLPPHERPHLPTLKRLGFSSIEEAFIQAPEIFYACCSAASMWTANAATVSPSADSLDHKVHFTPANLINKLHRSIEAPMTSRFLKVIFLNSKYFVHHEALPAHPSLGDEGAANHTRFCTSYEQPGVQLFVYGKNPKRFPARQNLEASKAIARLHQLDPKRVIFAEQNSEAIDAGVFHNDVASVGNKTVFFTHEQAFVNQRQIIQKLQEKLPILVIEVPASQVSLEEAVRSYLFNSQLFDNLLLAPIECQEVPSVKKFLENAPFEKVEYLDLRQSMKNGGGPACLRLRVVLTEAELAACNPKVFFTETLDTQLVSWVKKYYRDRLLLQDLHDPALYKESCLALDKLTQMFNLGNVYDFQN